MAKGTSAKDYRGKKPADLSGELKKLRDELQNIRFTRVSGTAVSKLSKIKLLRKQIARILTIIRENNKNDVVSKLKNRTKKVVKDGKEVEEVVKNIKKSHIPLDLRLKKTRAIRRKLTKFESKKLTLKLWKRKLNYPLRKFAVPVQN